MSAAPTQKPETLALIFELGRTAPDDQLKASAEVDTKIFQAFTAACLLIGLASLRGIGNHHHRAEVAIVAVAVGAFVITAGVAIEALWSRRYRVPMSPKQLVDKYWYDDPAIITDAFVHDVAEGYVENERHLRAKHKSLRRALVALLVEAAAVGASLIASGL